MKRYFLSVTLVVILLAGLLGPGSGTVEAAGITVNSDQDNTTGGNGLCTLREAIRNANDNTDYTGGDCAAGSGPDIITFASQMAINLDTSKGPLNITSQVTIDASGVWNTDRPGVSVNGVDQNLDCVTIDEAAQYVEIYGLFIYNGYSAIDIQAPFNTIGGELPGQRNVLSHNFQAGITLYGADAHDNVIQGNWIGLSVTGDTADPNGDGVVVMSGAHHNWIGAQMVGNYISGNSYSGVYIVASDTQYNTLLNNVIGLPAVGSQPVGNGSSGVQINQAHFNTVGGEFSGNTISKNGGSGVRITGGSHNLIMKNTISYNQGHGVEVDGGSAQDDEIDRNSIHHNGGSGIRLLNGANLGIAAPIITNAGAAGVVGTACPGCMVQIFSDSEDEGVTFHGAPIADSSGNWNFNVWPLGGPNITATSTDTPNHNTSEFSLPYPVGSGTCAGPLAISCGRQVRGNTTGHASDHNSYSCSTWAETGPEVIYQFTLPAGATYAVEAALSGLQAGVDLDIFLLSSAGCSAGTCLAAGSWGDWSATAAGVPAGTYYIAVDGFAGAYGSYQLSLACTAVFTVSLPLVVRNY